MKNKIIASVIAALLLPMLIFIHWAIVYFLSVRIVLAIAMTVSIIVVTYKLPNFYLTNILKNVKDQ